MSPENLHTNLDVVFTTFLFMSPEAMVTEMWGCMQEASGASNKDNLYKHLSKGTY